VRTLLVVFFLDHLVARVVDQTAVEEVRLVAIVAVVPRVVHRGLGRTLVAVEDCGVVHVLGLVADLVEGKSVSLADVLSALGWEELLSLAVLRVHVYNRRAEWVNDAGKGRLRTHLVGKPRYLNVAIVAARVVSGDLLMERQLVLNSFEVLSVGGGRVSEVSLRVLVGHLWDGDLLFDRVVFVDNLYRLVVVSEIILGGGVDLSFL